MKIALIFALLVLISYFVIIIFGDNGLRDLNAMKQELKNIETENEKLQQENIEKHRKVKRLKEDPEYIENIARQELKMIKDDEVVFKFQQKNTAGTRQIKERPKEPSPLPADPIHGSDPNEIQSENLPE